VPPSSTEKRKRRLEPEEEIEERRKKSSEGPIRERSACEDGESSLPDPVKKKPNVISEGRRYLKISGR